MAERDRFRHLLALRPENAAAKLADSPVCLLNSHHILQALKDRECIVMAANTRIKHVIPGIMRAAKDTDAVVSFQLAKSESDLSGGYTGWVPESYFQSILEYADRVGYFLPFFIHGDHITIKNTSEAEINTARELIVAQLDAGYTSFCVDASFNPLADNIRITAELAKPIKDASLGLEVEVGEIKSAGLEGGEITTVEEAVEFITGLEQRGIHPDLLAINNGSKHGNYLEGEEISIDLERTGEIYQAIKPRVVGIAQHGITGTPLHIVGKFAEYGIKKGNVGTQWQNIAHKELPPELMARMKGWAQENNKDVKMASKPFRAEIDGVDEDCKRRIEERSYQEAANFIKAFRSEGTASMVAEALKGGGSSP